MPVLRYKRFNKPRRLRQIGRELLQRFFESFANDLESLGGALPAFEIADDDYYDALARLLMNPESLPNRLNEALFAIDELSGPEGQTRLEATHSLSRPRLHSRV